MDLSKIKPKDMTEEQYEEYMERTSLSALDAQSARKHLKQNAENFLKWNEAKKNGEILDYHEEKMYKRYIRNYYIWKYYNQYAKPLYDSERIREFEESKKNRKSLMVSGLRLSPKDVVEKVYSQKDEWLKNNPEKVEEYNAWFKKCNY